VVLTMHCFGCEVMCVDSEYIWQVYFAVNCYSYDYYIIEHAYSAILDSKEGGPMVVGDISHCGHVGATIY